MQYVDAVGFKDRIPVPKDIDVCVFCGDMSLRNLHEIIEMSDCEEQAYHVFDVCETCLHTIMRQEKFFLVTRRKSDLYRIGNVYHYNCSGGWYFHSKPCEDRIIYIYMDKYPKRKKRRGRTCVVCGKTYYHSRRFYCSIVCSRGR